MHRSLLVAGLEKIYLQMIFWGQLEKSEYKLITYYLISFHLLWCDNDIGII